MCPRFLFVDTNKSAHKGHHPHSHTWSTHGRNRTLTLQSTNEELETSKEEIDATNEELNTVNAELTDRNREMTHLSDYIEAVFNTVREPLLLLDPVLRVKQANRSFYELFRVSEDETVGQLVSKLATERWAVTDWTQLGKFVGIQSKSENLYLDIEFPSIGRRHMRVNARSVQLPVRSSRPS